MNDILQGLPASPGMSLGKAYFLKKPDQLIPKRSIDDAQINSELNRFSDAVEKSRLQIKESIKNSSFDDDLKEIFEMQLLLLEDPMLIDESIEKIKHQKINAEKALLDEIANLKSFLLKSKNIIFQDRVADLEDMGNRILSNLLNIPEGDVRIRALENMPKDSILIAADISPSLMLHIQGVSGIIVEEGGITGHMGILAKSREIPCLVNVEGILETVIEKQEILLDAVNGICVIQPDQRYIDTFVKYTQQKISRSSKNIDSPIKMTDGHLIELWSNLGDPGSANDTRIPGSSGVGLFRTEYLYLKETNLFNNFKKQKKMYEQILVALGNSPVVFRLLDTSTDKNLPGNVINNSHHLTGVQFLLANPVVTKLQIRCILEAALDIKLPENKLKIMIPMICMIEEVQKIQKLFQEVKTDMVNDLKITTNDIPEYELGVMLETPASILMIRELEKISDFFSIGSNDLAHFILGLPRYNSYFASEELFFQPSIFRMIKMITSQTKKPLTLCGEIAARIDIIPFLIGAGLNKLSMSPSSLLDASQFIQKLSYKECKKISDQAIQCQTGRELHTLLTSFISKY